MKRHGATLEHAQPQRARAGFDSDTLSALRRVLALAHYASVGGPGHSNCLLCQEAIRERARQQQLVRRQAYGLEPTAMQGAVPGAVQGAVCDSCEAQDAQFWSVDLSSNRSTLGSNHSDPRCAQVLACVAMCGDGCRGGEERLSLNAHAKPQTL